MSTQHSDQAILSAVTHPMYSSPDTENLTEPTAIFVCGSLMDPDVLTTVARLPDAPTLSDAHIIGHRSKLFGRFPALIPDEHADSPIRGKLWIVESAEQLQRIRSYMSTHYRSSRCKIYADGASGMDGLTFVWNEDPESEMLVDGEFDVDEYVRTIKPAVLASGKSSAKRG